jgi:hypothetical protein
MAPQLPIAVAVVCSGVHRRREDVQVRTGGGPPPQPGETERELASKTAQCMRTHGVPNFPDPNFGGNPGGKVLLPGSSSPAFQRAVKICRAGNRRIG